MSTTPGDPQHRFGPLPATECLARLRSHTIGRVGWNTTEGPQILPVSYVVRDGLIVFRTTPYGALSELRNVRQVAFEVDEFGHDGAASSVVVRGFSRQITGAWPLLDLLRDPRVVPWAAGPRTLAISIEPESITGRRLPAPLR